MYRRQVKAFTPNFDSKAKSVLGAGAPSPPSEEGGGCLHKGFEQADGGRDTPSMCESSRYRQEKRQMTASSLGVRLHLGANSDLALSLPQSRLCILWARQLCPLAVLRSCFSCSLSHLRTAAACLSRCSRHRRRAKAKPLRGSQGGSAASHRIAKARAAVKPASGGLPSSVTVRRSAAPRHLPLGEGYALPAAKHRFSATQKV